MSGATLLPVAKGLPALPAGCIWGGGILQSRNSCAFKSTGVQAAQRKIAPQNSQHTKGSAAGFHTLHPRAPLNAPKASSRFPFFIRERQQSNCAPVWNFPTASPFSGSGFGHPTNLSLCPYPCIPVIPTHFTNGEISTLRAPERIQSHFYFLRKQAFLMCNHLHDGVWSPGNSKG